ncbi:FIST C-terminal domain-containing protein [Thermaurantimonas aggregans]|nr:FIST C-terminal domain-containing protein [Thermaurantimonas aggregans]MCX8148119.1 FIST C-terminal domain-containing protein [Thermaurantimonas aggregans]
MTFAGDIPEGSTVRLMRSNSEKLIRGALQAADDALSLLQNPESAILVSCVGRKLVLRQLAEEELEAVQQELNADVVTGFYSYGELAPTGEMRTCELHNQTMTITTFSEV